MKKNILSIYLMFLMIPNQLNAQQPTTGSYNIVFPLGDNKIPGSLELYQVDDSRIKGRITLQLQFKLSFALSSNENDKGDIVFDTSSPAVSATISFDNHTDSIRGMLSLVGNRKFTFYGKRYSRNVDPNVINQFENHIEFLGSDSLGFAFPSISPDGKIMVFSAFRKDFSKQQLMYIRTKDIGKSQPIILPFSEGHNDRSPFFASNGNLYFSSKRSLDGENSIRDDYDIWRVKYKKNGKWEMPEKVEGLNSDANDYQPCVTNKGIFFTSKREGGFGGQDIYYAEGSNGKFNTPVNLGKVINSKDSEISVYVTENEELMILSTSSESLETIGNDDLYLFKKLDEEWKFTRNLGDGINTFVNEYGAYLSPDRRWLYYTSDINPFAKIYKIRWKND